MSDSEDDDVILDDIKALQAVLSQKQTVQIKKEVKSENLTPVEHNLCEPSTSKISDELYTSKSNTVENDPLLNEEEENESECNSENEEEEEEDDDEEEGNNFNDLSDPEVALNLNQKIITLLLTARKRLQLLLKECKQRQILIDKKIHEKTSNPVSRMLLSIAGIPYFKDKQQFPCPKNRDAIIKAKRGELQIIDLPCPLRWTIKDRNILWEAIYSNATAMSQEARRKREARGHEISSNNAEDPLKLDYKCRNKKIPEEMVENMKQLVGPLGSKEFDWLKIAATDFNGRHSASECRAMWNVFLHPDINKGKWKKNEDSDLKILANKYNFQNWDEIAKKLETNRTGYQCFIRFNTNFKNDMFTRSSYWSKEEDQKLTDTVNALRTGNFIPWGEVAKLMPNRRKQQIYMRWNYSIAPNLKKGRFTEEEDKLLLEGVAKYGSNFTKISVALLPHRNTAQLNDHYRTLMNEKKNYWDCEDDMKLVSLFDKFGNNWSAISKEFTNKSRVQVRHRHTAIIRHLNKGLSIRTIPRWGQKIEDTQTPQDTLDSGEYVLNQMSEAMRSQLKEKEAEKRERLPKIDLELRDYFKGMYQSHPSKPGRNKKFYTHEELNEKTQKLHVVLNMLNADLDIPDDLEEEVFLRERDKQLLTSLKEFSRNESLELEARQKYIEHIRRKMFGNSTPSTDGERFIPPLPFDGKVQRCKKAKLIGLNYIPSGDKCFVEVPKELNTSETIISLIGGWDSEIEFQNMEKIFIGKTEQSPKNVFKTSSEHKSNLDLNTPSTSGMMNDENRDFEQEILFTAKNQSSSQTISRRMSKYYSEMVIPPNYVTLLGFRGILLSKHILEAEDSEEDEYEEEECRITPDGERALELFEDRLVKLFKFPIELSEIPPPLLHSLKNGIFDDIVGNDCDKKRKSTRTSPRQVAKKKTKPDETHTIESSETE